MRDVPFSGDAAMSSAQATPWWGRSGYAGWGASPTPASPSAEGPFRGDSEGIRPILSPMASNMATAPSFMQARVPPPPPPPPPGHEGLFDLPFGAPPSSLHASHPDLLPMELLGRELKEVVLPDPKKKKKKKESKDREKVADGGSREVRDEISAEIDVAVSKPGSILQKADFDSGVRRYLGALRGCQNGKQKVKDAMAMLHHYTAQKMRSAVKNWPAYLLTLLKRFEPGLLSKGLGKGDRKGEDARRPPSAAEAAAFGLPGASDRGPLAFGKPLVKLSEAQLPVSRAAKPRQEVAEVLPQFWTEGRQPLLREVSHALSADIIKSPFTGEALDLQEALVAPVAAALSTGRNAAPEPKSFLWRYAQGVAACRDLMDCPRALAAAQHAKVEDLADLSEDASSLQGVQAISSAAREKGGAAAVVAETVLEEIGLEILAETLRNPDLSPGLPVSETI